MYWLRPLPPPFAHPPLVENRRDFDATRLAHTLDDVSALSATLLMKGVSCAQTGSAATVVTSAAVVASTVVTSSNVMSAAFINA